MPNLALTWGIKILSIHESNGIGLKASTVFKQTEPTDPMTMGHLWIMLVVDVIVYCILIWYVEGVKPGKFGVAKKWYFPFSKSYWFPKKKSHPAMTNGVHLNSIPTSVEDEDSYFEREPSGLYPGIVVENLRKVFKPFRAPQVVAVDNVSFKAYQGQITALLGHNGAGKTTTMSILTGMYSGSGLAKIDGIDISQDLSSARKSLGLCPQHNMLFMDLTVSEHLLFFGMLKGLGYSKAKAEAKDYIAMLNLVPKANIVVSKLSGGMKRKVNLGIALIGDSKVVLLDEPTSGMDPEARRGMWDLLQQLKKDRTILLTTHFMEEADILGDRIAIMASGRVHTSGSPLFLKKKFGKGYTLTMSSQTQTSSAKVLETIQKDVKQASIESEASGEIIVNLPDTQTAQFPYMFKNLEAQKASLGILNFGLSVTTMDDVFLRVGSMVESQSSPQKNGSQKKWIRNQW